MGTCRQAALGKSSDGRYRPRDRHLGCLGSTLRQPRLQRSAEASRDRGKKNGPLRLQLDEAWSFVQNKENKQWIWLAFDADSKEIVGMHVGDRSRTSAQALWDSLPESYRERAVCHTDFWEAYKQVLPSQRHHAVGKDSGKTNGIERWNCTLRQRVARLVRKTLSFSKKFENHLGALWLFIHHYNASLHA